jgi:hypothetical protein
MRTKSSIHITLFTFILSLIGIGLFILPKIKHSEKEKRNLVTLPKFSFVSWKNGDFTDSLDLFTADHFPQRYFFLSLADCLKNSKGIAKEGQKIYTTVAAIDKIVVENPNEEDSLATFQDKEQLRNSKGLVVTAGQGIQIFSNEQPMTKEYATTILNYRKKLGEKIRIFCAITPTVGTYKMPADYATYSNKEQENIGKIYQQLAPTIQSIPIAEELQKHQNEYIFYRTDHHWTGLGAYYAYIAFCKKAGLDAIGLDKMTKNSVEGAFLGTHYLKTNDKSLQTNADTVFYFVPKIEASATKWKDGKMIDTPLFQLKEIEKNRYLVFLGGDEPYMQIKSSVKNGKTILLIKNSYGNALASYLVANYENILIVDYRYFKLNLLDMIQKNNVNDLLFVSGVFAANEPTHIKKVGKILQ